jgi:branched-chain amino acid transport system substrate-binding protein
LTRRTLLALAAGSAFGQAPYKDRSKNIPQSPDTGEPEDEDFTSIPIAYFGPSDPTHPLGGSAWLGVSAGIDRANRDGGYKGKPFRLIPVWAPDPWKGGVSQLARVTYGDRVRAILTGIDGNTAHLAEQIATKALVPVVDIASTDKTVNGAAVPWIFSATPADDAIAAALAPAIERVAGHDYTILAGIDHDSRKTAEALKAKLAPERILDYETEIPPVPEGAKAVVIIAGPLESAKLLAAAKAQAPKLPVFGGPMMARSSFLRTAGANANGATVPLLAKLSKEHPDWDYTALMAEASALLLAGAISQAGLRRSAIRNKLHLLPAPQGAEWAPDGRTEHPAGLAKIANGQLVPLP